MRDFGYFSLKNASWSNFGDFRHRDGNKKMRDCVMRGGGLSIGKNKFSETKLFLL